MSVVRISSITVYPLKSGSGINQLDTIALPTGLYGDRHLIITDSTGNFVTQRQMPTLSQLQAQLGDGSIRIQKGSNYLDLSVPTPKQRTARVKIWNDSVSAIDLGDNAAEFLLRNLGKHRGRTMRLYMKDEHREAWDGTQVHPYYFADGFPYLVTNEASLRDLQSRIKDAHGEQDAEIMMERFRPNLVLSGLEPWDEDNIASIATQDVTLSFVKPCARCVITMTDQQSARRGPEPLRTLRKFRQSEEGICFGQNAVLTRGDGQRIAVGDEVSIEWKNS